MRKLTTKEWITKAELVHANKYNYSKVIYQNCRTKVIIVCPIHGEFEQLANHHLQGHGCPQCKTDKNTKRCTKDLKWFILNSNIVHNNFYSYSKSIYTKVSEKIIITCSIHGDFKQIAESHLQGQGCPKCAIKYRSQLHTKPIESFIKECNKIHNNKYDYSLVKYNVLKDKVKIICPIHGEFLQIGSDHLKGCGCNVCKSSKGELLIYNWLQKNNIEFKFQHEIEVHKLARNTNTAIIDFFVIHNDKQYFIEYDGIQHFKYIPYFHKGGKIDFIKEQRRDRVLNEFCELHKDKVTLIRFDYNQSVEEILSILDKIL